MFCANCRENLGQNENIMTSRCALAYLEKMRFDAHSLCRGGILSCLIDVMRTELLQQVTEKPAGLCVNAHTRMQRLQPTLAATD